MKLNPETMEQFKYEAPTLQKYGDMQSLTFQAAGSGGGSQTDLPDGNDIHGDRSPEADGVGGDFSGADPSANGTD